MAYQRLYLASITVQLTTGPQTIIGVSHFESGAATHIAERLENHGFTNAQIGKILDRVRVTEMTSGQLGATLMLPGELRQIFGRRI